MAPPSTPPPQTTTSEPEPSDVDLHLYALPECSNVLDGALDGGDNLVLFVAVRDGGPQPVSGPVVVTVSSDTGLSSRATTGVSAGSTFTGMEVSLGSSDYNKTHHFTITADPDDDVAERDEENNQLRISVPLGSRQQSEGDVPCTSP